MKIKIKDILLRYAFCIVFFAVLIGLSYLIRIVTGCNVHDAFNGLCVLFGFAYVTFWMYCIFGK